MSTNDPQQQMIRGAMQAIAQRKPGKTKLVYDKTKRTIVAVAEGSQPPRALNITADDADMFAVATLSSAWLRKNWTRLVAEGCLVCRFSSWDDGDAFTQYELGPLPSETIVEALVCLAGHDSPGDQAAFRIHLSPVDKAGNMPSAFVAPDGSAYQASGAMAHSKNSLAAVFADIQRELSARRSGILETTILADKAVLFIGLGTGGAHAALELAKCGVGRFALADRDRLSAGNVVRHPGGISQVGRLKVNVVRDLILDKNPDAGVSTHFLNLTFANKEELRKLVTEADVVVCGTDNRQSKLLVNQLCVEANVPAIYGGAFRRAYAVEPGLSLDVQPIANMVAKLALSELLKDKPSTLRVLERDYDAPWYLWLNRPEPATPYSDWPPLSESSDEMTINRWYGIYFDRDAECPTCGDFLSSLAANYGLDLGKLGAIPSAPAVAPMAAPTEG